MLNEKKVMSDKVLELVGATILSGILFGFGISLAVATVVTKAHPGFGFLGILLVFASAFLAWVGDKIQTQIRKYIMSPYVTLEDNDDRKDNKDSAVLDPPAD